jgi:hypothetical protein
MSTMVAEMSVADLRELIEELLEEKLGEILGDPDEGLTIRPEVREQLLRQMDRVQRREYGVLLSEIAE